MPAIRRSAGPAVSWLPEVRGENSHEAAAAGGRALVPVSPVAASKPLRQDTRRPMPSFLAHLAATALHAPQTRVIRRASQAEAVAAYGVTLAPRLTTGRRLRRWA